MYVEYGDQILLPDSAWEGNKQYTTDFDRFFSNIQ